MNTFENPDKGLKEGMPETFTGFHQIDAEDNENNFD